MNVKRALVVENGLQGSGKLDLLKISNHKQLFLICATC